MLFFLPSALVSSCLAARKLKREWWELSDGEKVDLEREAEAMLSESESWEDALKILDERYPKD